MSPPPNEDAGVPVAELLAVTSWVTLQDLPARQDDLLALLIRRRAPAAVLRLLASTAHDCVFGTLDDVLVEVVRGCRPD